MRMIARLFIIVCANAIGLVASAYLIPDFHLVVGIQSIAILAGILTLLNFFLKPVLKLVLGPLIVLTLGLGIIIVNALVLFVLDFLYETLTIQSIPALVYSSIIIGVVNFVFHLGTERA